MTVLRVLDRMEGKIDPVTWRFLTRGAQQNQPNPTSCERTTSWGDDCSAEVIGVWCWAKRINAIISKMMTKIRTNKVYSK